MFDNKQYETHCARVTAEYTYSNEDLTWQERCERILKDYALYRDWHELEHARFQQGYSKVLLSYFVQADEIRKLKKQLGQI